MVIYQETLQSQKNTTQSGVYMFLMKSASFAAHNALMLIIGLFGIAFLIGFHELGHFLFCKLFGIRTPSFSIGFGPRLLSKKIGETEFSLSAIPLGGYVEIAGAHEVGQGEQKDAFASDEGSFSRKPFYQKLLVMFGGILFNLVFAYAALIFIFWVGIGKTEIMYPRNATPIISSVLADSPAQKAGLEAGDVIKEINGKSVGDNGFLIYKELAANPHQTIPVTYEHNGEQHEVSIALGSRITPLGKTEGTLGILFEMGELKSTSFLLAIKEGISLTNMYIKSIFLSFKQIFSKRDVSKMAGPLMVISQTMKGAGEGTLIFLLFLAIISVNLAILNLIPLPILDGGQILFCTIEWIVRRPISPRIREYIHIGSWILVLGLMLYLSGQDIKNIFWPKISALLGLNK